MAETIREEHIYEATQTSSPPNVISFLQTLNGSAHPALDAVNNGVIFDAPKMLYIVEPSIESLNDEVKREAELFAEALKAYESEVPQKYKTGVLLDKPHSIEDVVKHIDSGLKEYKRDAEKTVWEAIRKGFWRLSQSKEGLETWLKLLPSSSTYCSLVYGGLNLIIQAAGRIGDVRNEAFKALEEIPFYLESTKDSVGVFEKSEALRKCGVKLYTVTLQALRHILTWFKKRAIGKTFATLLKQGLYQKELFTKVDEMKMVSTRFRYISMGCMQREVVSTRKAVTSMAVASGNNHLIIKKTMDETNENLKHQKSVNMTQHETTQRMIDKEFNTLKTRYDDQLELNQKNADALNNLKVLLESILVALPLFLPISNDPPPYERDLEPQIQSIPSSKILSVLAHKKDISEVDLHQSLRSLNTLSRSDQDRAVWVMKSSALCSWLPSTTSSMLYINGSCPSTRTHSPITSVCAHLIYSLKSKIKDKTIILHFFCGQHLSPATDLNATPVRLMNSLLAQLLLQRPNFKISQRDLIDTSPTSLESVQCLFKNLLLQLEEELMVFCIIDGISFYEDVTRVVEIREVMHALRELVTRKEESGPIFKVLLTSSTRIRNLPEIVEKGEVLNVPREVRSQAGLSVFRNTEKIPASEQEI
ncbi:hypothetical protein B0O99DRAFT_746143 [Bisporella sp. PMI_857]|nr:hypothetical protein B0O99DRAFT_746143 [Bisporella sp. PMI_857]